ncbi:MAG: hypothetical protein C0407_04955 [Desulfobacca sp.]|nr:hypothetical protein [Desulfobacca sp.]
MLIKPDCVPCILKMSTSAIRNLTDDEEILKELTIKILQIPALRGLDWGLSSPEVIARVMAIVNETFKTSDPFRALKEEQNRKGLELYPGLKQMVKESSDPLFTAVNMAVLGNFIDLMVSDRSIEPAKTLEKDLNNIPIPKTSFLEFAAKLKKARLLLYIGDNSGEVVFDKVLIETIKEQIDPEIFFAVRGVPALNDVTIQEARQVGIDSVAALIENGQKDPVPGTILSRCSPEFTELFQKADLIISKGGGNFDALDEEKDHGKDITFLLLAKCHPYCHHFQTQLYQPILSNVFH